MPEPTNVIVTFQSVWDVVLAFLASIGGASVIIIAVVKFTSERMADRLQAKYQLKLDKEMETYKADLEKILEQTRTQLGTKQHISVKRFDAEFEIYQKLSFYFSTAVKDCAIMIPRGFHHSPANRDDQLKQDEEHSKTANLSVVDAQNYLLSVIPFIPDDFYKEYREILNLLSMQLEAYLQRYDVDRRPQEEKECFGTEAYIRTGEIENKYEELNRKVREYLNSLDVVS